MTPRRLALAVVLVVVAASVGVGAATPAATAASAETPTTPTAANASASPLGERITMAMQANAAQAEGAVENGMWAAAFANASNQSTKRALVERRVGQLNGTIAELQAERRALRSAYRNGTIDRSTYRARLSALVGRLAAVGEGIEETSERGAAVGVNRSRLDELRTQARNVSGGEVSELARSLAGPPGASGVFGDGPPGQSGDRKAENASGPPTSPGPGEAGNTTRGGNDTAGGQGPPDDRGRDADEGTTTPTATES